MVGRGFVSNWNSPEWALSNKACEVDDTALMDQAISMTAEENLEPFYNHVRRSALWHSAIAILNNLIERGVPVTPYWPSDAMFASKETLELLLAQGWDINARGDTENRRQPFMWYVSDKGDMVEWCLEHGASIHPRGQEQFRDGVTAKSSRECLQILERVAANGNVATFELLRSKGAPLGWSSLHLAVKTAALGCPENEGDERCPGERMAMVRHLLDVVGLDVNAPDEPVDRKGLPVHNRTPICYIAGYVSSESDTRELTWLLLDRGADPTPALEIAELNYPRFVEDVKAWKAQQGGDSKCCAQ